MSLEDVMDIQAKVKEALETGKWLLRRSNAGCAYGGFQWNPIGEWTEAPDWNPSPECGGGLHGNGPQSSGYWTNGSDLDFCIYDGEFVEIDGEKGKVKRAAVLLRNQLPDGLSVGGSLNLENTQITSLPDGLSVGGSLDLENTQITSLPDGLSVGGFLDLRGTQITSLPDGLKGKTVW